MWKKSLMNLIGMFGTFLLLSSCANSVPVPTSKDDVGLPSAPVLNNLVIAGVGTESIMLQQPTFSTAGNPAPTVSAYIGFDGMIFISGSLIEGSLEGPIDVSSADYRFKNLELYTDYRIIVMAENSEGYSFKQIVQTTSTSPFINIDPVGDRHVGDKFTIIAQTNLELDDEVTVSVYFSALKQSDVEDCINGSSIDSCTTGTVKVQKGDSGYNKVSFDVDSSTFKPDEYLVTMDGVLVEVTGTALFNVQEQQ